LDSQLTENNGVRDELKLLEGDANVFKLIGPVLIKQDLDEARQNVDKRIDYITGEMYIFHNYFFLSFHFISYF